MRSTTLPLAFIASFLLVACGDKETEDTAPEGDTDTDTDADGDTDTDSDADTDIPGEVTITSVEYSYTATNWRYGATSTGMANALLVEAFTEIGEIVIHEEHPLDELGAIDDPVGQAWGVNLVIVGELADQEDGVSTLFRGEEQAANNMTWKATIIDPSGPVECVVWGARPAVFEDAGCRPITPN
jgi:hypothetical protein